VASNPVPAQVILERLLLSRATKGDHEAFLALALTHSDEAYAIARNLCASDTEAFDLTERAFQLAWNHLHTIPEKCSFRVFVCRFLLKNALERLRRSASISFLDTVVRPDTGATHVGCGCAEIERLARRRDIVERLGDALLALDPDDRAAFVLQIVQAIPADDAAAILEVPVSAVRQRTHFACSLVRAYLVRLCAGTETARETRIWVQ
jgi:RNA polymerase sigma-70 factor, ECF subfamily